MGTVLSTILITAPLAFIVGWLASKAVFRHMSVTRPHAVVPPTPVLEESALQTKAAVTAEAEPEVAFELLTKLKKQLASSESNNQAAKNEIQALREAVAEGEHRMADLGKKLQVAHTLPEDSQAGVIAVRDAHVAKQLRKMQNRAETLEQENVTMRREVISVEKRLDSATTRFHKWRVRFGPLAKQFRQQKLIINELRDELRRREQDAAESAAHEQQKEQAPAVVQLAATRTPEQVDQQLRDNLEKLHGIGPALHRKLNDRGIFRLQQLAALGSDELLQLGKSLGVSDKLMHKHDWSAQARTKLGQSAPAVAINVVSSA